MTIGQWRNDSYGDHSNTRTRICPIATFSTKILDGLPWNRTRVSGVKRRLNYSEGKSGDSNNYNNNTFYVMHLRSFVISFFAT
jgi:hypothetical protein